MRDGICVTGRQGTRTLWSSHARDEERLHRDHVPPSLSVAWRNGRQGFLGKGLRGSHQRRFAQRYAQALPGALD